MTSLSLELLPFAAFIRRDFGPLARHLGMWFAMGVAVFLPIYFVLPSDWGIQFRDNALTMTKMFLALGVFAAMTILPVMGALAAVSETRNNTMVFLAMLPAHPVWIVLARIIGVSMAFAMVCIGVMPVLVMFTINAAYTAAPVLVALLLLIALGAVNTAMGVAIGFALRGTLRATAVVIVWCTVLHFAILPGVLAVMRGAGSSIPWNGESIPGLLVRAIPEGGRPYYMPQWGLPLGILGVLFLLAWMLAVLLLSRSFRGPGRIAQMRQRRGGKPRPPIPEGRNPVYIKELRTGFFSVSAPGPLRFVPLPVWIAAGGAVFAFFTCKQMDSSHGFFTLFNVMMLAIVPGAAASSLMREKTGDTHDLLRLTLITPREVVLAHHDAVLFGTWKVQAAFAAGAWLVLLAVHQWRALDPWLLLTQVLAMSQVPMLTMIGNNIAASSRGFTSAVVGAYGAAFTIYLCGGFGYGAVMASFLDFTEPFDALLSLVLIFIFLNAVIYFFGRKSAVQQYETYLRPDYYQEYWYPQPQAPRDDHA